MVIDISLQGGYNGALWVVSQRAALDHCVAATQGEQSHALG